ncbi:MAG: MBL fold metallo-hydrolase [Dongiaceae bacterium]
MATARSWSIPARGNDKERPYASYFDHLQTPFLERLRALGVEPEDVDYVLHTHLHVDHVGWNTLLQGGEWVPTFPNARYIFSRAEYDYFTDPKNHTERSRTSFMVQRDSVDPVIEAGLAQMIEIDGSEPIEGFAFHPTPGHTIDHASISFHSQGEVALFAGDVLHHPLQVSAPIWSRSSMPSSNRR